MEKIKYRDLIMQYLTALEPDQTITTEQVAEYVAERLLLDTGMVKKTVNVNMARLEKEGQIMRLTKGIYCRRVKTAFGYYTPDKETLFHIQLSRFLSEVTAYKKVFLYLEYNIQMLFLLSCSKFLWLGA